MENENTKVPSHKVQDPKMKYAKYRLNFVKIVTQVNPQIIEELRELTQNFKRLFTRKSYLHYSSFFNALRINLIMVEMGFPQELKPNNRYIPGYEWASLEFLIRLLTTKQWLSSGFSVHNYPSEEIQIIENNKEALDRLEQAIQKHFNLTCDNPDLVVPNFCKIQNKIFAWVKKYNLHKDWLVEYAYFFLYQFSQDPNLDIKDIDIVIKKLDYYSTVYTPFEFKSLGWFAGEYGESAIEYKTRVTREFEEKLNLYIIEASKALKLNELSKFTKSPTYESVKWLAYWCVKKWNAEIIVENFFGDIYADRTKGTSYFLTYENKVKHIKREMRKLKAFNLPTPEDV